MYVKGEKRELLGDPQKSTERETDHHILYFSTNALCSTGNP